jgi:hypothetical protein
MHMSHRPSRMQQPGIIVALALCVLALSTACASDQPKPLSQPTPDQVRSHADRAFEKLKQEEQERAVQPPALRY